MKRFHAGLVLAIGLCAGVAGASEFDDFRIPESHLQRYQLSLSGAWSANSDNRPSLADRRSSAYGDLSGVYQRQFDSDRLSWSWFGSARTTGTRERDSERQLQDFTPIFGSLNVHAREYESAARGVSEAWHLGGQLSTYPWAPPVGAMIAGDFGGAYDQLWQSDRLWTRDVVPSFEGEDLSRSSRSRWSYANVAAVTASIAFGRIRDATAVFSVELLEERLLRDHALSRALSPGARQRLADLFALAPEFGVAHALPDKFFWSEVERVMREDGALSGTELGGFGAQHAEDPLVVAGGRFARAVGVSVGPALQYVHAHAIVREDAATSTHITQTGSPPFDSEYRQSSRGTSSQDDLAAGVQARYGRPLGMRTQFDLSASAFQDPNHPRQFSESALASLGHLIGERWLLASSLRQARVFRVDPDRFAAWSVRGTLGATWFLEDYLRLDLAVVHEVDGRDPDAFSTPTAHARFIHSEVSLGMTVGRGRVEAPALSGPLRASN